jgi:hypothetical protein
VEQKDQARPSNTAEDCFTSVPGMGGAHARGVFLWDPPKNHIDFSGAVRGHEKPALVIESNSNRSEAIIRALGDVGICHHVGCCILRGGKGCGLSVREGHFCQAVADGDVAVPGWEALVRGDSYV